MEKHKKIGKYNKYIKSEVKIIGATFHEDVVLNDKINWIKKEEKILKIIKSHEKRQISLCGKVLLTNTILFS